MTILCPFENLIPVTALDVVIDFTEAKFIVVIIIIVPAVWINAALCSIFLFGSKPGDMLRILHRIRCVLLPVSTAFFDNTNAKSV